MSSIIRNINNIGRSIGLFSVLASMAFALIAAPATSAAAAPSSSLPIPSTGGTVTTFVFDRLNGRPIAGAEVVVLSSAGITVAKGVTPATGTLRFSLRPGIYKVSVSARGFTSGGGAFKVYAGQLSALRIGLNTVDVGPLPGN